MTITYIELVSYKIAKEDTVGLCNSLVYVVNGIPPENDVFHGKGHLISECLFDLLNFPKNQQKFDEYLP